jgi:CheY-like chemotaxis protein
MVDEKPELLLFDDEVDTGDLAQDRLEDYFEVTYCSTEAQLREEIERDRFSVIACDVSIQNSDKDGYEIVNELRIQYDIRNVPVVVYSAVRNMAEIKKQFGGFFDDYVRKDQANWAKDLLHTCKKAEKKNPRNVEADVYKRWFTNHMDDHLDVSLSPDAEIMGVKRDDALTVRIAIEKLETKENYKNKTTQERQLDDETADVYKQALSNYADHIENQL